MSGRAGVAVLRAGVRLRASHLPECGDHTVLRAAHIREGAGHIRLRAGHVTECAGQTLECGGYIRLSAGQTALIGGHVPECGRHIRLSDFRTPLSDRYSFVSLIWVTGHEKPGGWNTVHAPGPVPLTRRPAAGD